MLGDNHAIPEQALYKISVDNLQQITIKDLTLNPNQLWRVIKPGEACPIKPGDMLKIGKIKL